MKSSEMLEYKNYKITSKSLIFPIVRLNLVPI